MREHTMLSERTVMVGKATSPNRVTVEFYRRQPNRDQYPKPLSPTRKDACLLRELLLLAVGDADALDGYDDDQSRDLG